MPEGWHRLVPAFTFHCPLALRSQWVMGSHRPWTTVCKCKILGMHVVRLYKARQYFGLIYYLTVQTAANTGRARQGGKKEKLLGVQT